MKRIFSALIFMFSITIIYSQKITVISKTTNKPLSNVLVFDNEGNVVTKSDINGSINKEELSKGDYHLLSYDNAITDTLTSADLDKNEFYISDKVVEIKPVAIEKKDVLLYYIKGYFVTYVLLNKKFNCYSDGIITYQINKQDNTVGDEYVEQYRVFTLKDNSNLKWKSVASFDFKTMMKPPKLDVPENLKKYIDGEKYTVTERKAENEDYSFKLKNVEDKETSFLGIVMNHVSREMYASYLTGASNKNFPFLYLNKFSNTGSLDMKHKSEENNNEVVLYTEFVPIEILYDKPKGEVNFSKNKSSYKEPYWEESYFPNTIKLFNSFFKDDIEEQKNAVAK